MRFAACVEQDVSRLDVAMEDSVLVRVVHRARHFGYYFRRPPPRYRRSAYDFVKLTAFDKFHAEIARSITLAHLIDGNDKRVIEACGGCRFASKTLLDQAGLHGEVEIS